MNLRFSILGNEVVIETDVPEFAERLDDIAVRADDSLRIVRTIHLRAFHSDGRFRVEQDGRVQVWERDPDLAIRSLHLWLNHVVMEPQKDVLKLHAGAASWNGRFFLATGDRGAGKTTLLLKMMLDGAEMHCDETVILADRGVRTFPRKFYVKEGTLKCLPRVAELCKNKRAYPGFYGGRFYFLDPTDAGMRWRSREDQPWAVFHLTPSFDEPPQVRPCAKVEMAKHLLLQAINLSGDFGAHVAEVCRLLETCRCYSLRVGELGATAELVKAVLAEP